VPGFPVECTSSAGGTCLAGSSAHSGFAGPRIFLTPQIYLSRLAESHSPGINTFDSGHSHDLMAIFNCAQCGHTQSAPDEYVGKRTRCPSCDQRGMIVEDANALTVLPHLPAESDAPAQVHEIRRCSGGSIRTRLGYGIVLNEHSSIKREWNLRR